MYTLICCCNWNFPFKIPYPSMLLFLVHNKWNLLITIRQMRQLLSLSYSWCAIVKIPEELILLFPSYRTITHLFQITILLALLRCLLYEFSSFTESIILVKSNPLLMRYIITCSEVFPTRFSISHAGIGTQTICIFPRWRYEVTSLGVYSGLNSFASNSIFFLFSFLML